MKNKTFLILFCGLIAGVLGIVETVAAKPGGPQRLRGLDDRQFMVTVEVVSSDFVGVPVGDTFPNCYVFNAGGEWIDQGFPIPDLNNWEQHSVGAKTSYNAWAGIPGVIFLTQEGLVTPAMGGGVLQLTAISEVFVAEGVIEGVPQDVNVEYYSVGFEVEQCYTPE